MSESPGSAAPAKLRVVVADDDPFMALVVSEALRIAGYLVATAATPNEAWDIVVRDEPHVIISDLDFGPAEHESGAALLARIDAQFPWIGLLLLTSHMPPVFVVDEPSPLPPRAAYLAKSLLTGVGALTNAVRGAIASIEHPRPESGDATRSAAEEHVLDRSGSTDV